MAFGQDRLGLDENSPMHNLDSEAKIAMAWKKVIGGLVPLCNASGDVLPTSPK